MEEKRIELGREYEVEKEKAGRIGEKEAENEMQ
jgi:hypothetical protein